MKKENLENFLHGTRTNWQGQGGAVLVNIIPTLYVRAAKCTYVTRVVILSTVEEK